MNEYIPKVIRFLEENPECAIKSPVCTYWATCVNHTNGRENERLLDEKYWEPSCHPCNNHIEEKDAWARENKHKLYKHQKL